MSSTLASSTPPEAATLANPGRISIQSRDEVAQILRRPGQLNPRPRVLGPDPSATPST